MTTCYNEISILKYAKIDLAMRREQYWLMQPQHDPINYQWARRYKEIIDKHTKGLQLSGDLSELIDEE